MSDGDEDQPRGAVKLRFPPDTLVRWAETTRLPTREEVERAKDAVARSGLSSNPEDPK
jgi:hypothetical protein